MKRNEAEFWVSEAREDAEESTKKEKEKPKFYKYLTSLICCELLKSGNNLLIVVSLM